MYGVLSQIEASLSLKNATFSNNNKITAVMCRSLEGISEHARLQTASILTEFYENLFITCGGETFNDVH